MLKPKAIALLCYSKQSAYSQTDTYIFAEIDANAYMLVGTAHLGVQIYVQLSPFQRLKSTTIYLLFLVT